MAAAAISGTTSSHGGTMITASGSLLTEDDEPVCLLGDSHSCPIPHHGVTQIVSGCTVNTIVDGKAVAIAGSVAGCGATLNGNLAADIDLT